MSLSYNIDNLLQTDDSCSPSDDRAIEDISDQSFSDNEEDQSDAGFKTDFTPYIRKFNRKTKTTGPEDIRLRVNSRERQRMHDLNSALDSLRQVMPFSQGPSVKKISKMSTLLLARNYIVMLNKSLDEMRNMVNELSHKQPSPVQRKTASVSIGLDRLHPSTGHHPLQSQFLTPSTNFVYSAEYLHGQGPAVSQVTSFYSPLKLAGLQKPEVNNIHMPSAPCPCNFCQTSLMSLPKPKWKQPC